MSRLVVASVGTYHLPFNRFSAWLGRWFSGRHEVELVMQHGPSQPVEGARNLTTLPYDALMDLCRSADVVVLQGGAGGVMDMRQIGVCPIVVPRVPGAGEVVDDHQIVFCEAMERLGIVDCARSYDELEKLLEARLADHGDGTRLDEKLRTPGAEAVRVLLSQPIRPVGGWTTMRRAASVFSAVLLDKLRRKDR